jgi:hypothetical protein
LANKTYENLIFEREVSIAIENLFVAPYPTTWTATPVADILDPPSGFTWLGAVVEDSPSVTVSRDLFQLQTGVPRVLQYQAVTTVAGRFECQLYSNSPRKVQYALGNVDAHNVLSAPSSPVAISSVTDKYTVTLTASPAVDWAVGDFIVTALTTNTLAISQNEAQISSINGANVTVGTPGFPNTPTTSHEAGRIAAVKSPFGTNQIKQYTLLGVAEFIDNVQIVHKFDKVSPSAEYAEQVRPDDVGKITLGFDAFGISNADYGGSYLIVGERFWFPKNA